MTGLATESGPVRRPRIGALNASLAGLFELEWLGMVDAANEHGADLVTFVGHELDDPADYRATANAIYELASAERLDGLVVWTTALGSLVGAERMEAFCRRFEPLPLVSVEQPLPGHVGVLFDDRGGMRAVVEHLLDVHGYRRIAFVRGPVTHPGAELRYQGYLDALVARGLPGDADLVPPPPPWWDAQHPVSAVTAMLEAGLRPDAIAAPSDFFAQAVIAGLRRRGLRVPDDVAVVGFDDLPNTAHFALGLENVDPGVAGKTVERAVNVSAAPPPLTTVRMPFATLGRRAVELLLARLRGEDVPDVETLEAELVVRRSCGCLGASLREPAPGEDGDANDVSDKLREAAVATTGGGRSDEFLSLLDSLARAEAPVDERPDWVGVIAGLRRWIGPRLESPEERSRAEDLWVRVNALMHEIAEQQLTFGHLINEKRDEIVRILGQRLVTARELDELGDVLAAELPDIGIPSCTIALYDPPPPEGARPPPEAVLAFACDRGRRIDLGEARRLRSIDLAPDAFLAREGPLSFLTLPLYFKEQQLGFVLFEAGIRVGWIYEALQGQIASALEGVLLVERERRALLAVEEGRRRLEERVAERTAELARANADLRQQIAVRERAEQMQARLEEQLRQAQKMEAVGRLAGGVAHDFNNLLVVINGYSDLLHEQVAGDEELASAVEQIQSAGERAAALTRQLLTFSRQEVLQPGLLDVNEIVGGVEAMLRRLIGEDVVLVTSLAPALGPVLADRGQLEQIVVNLAVNARDAMPGGGMLTIETAEVELDARAARERVGVEPGRYVALKVTDTGVGMDAETQARIFEPFFTTKAAAEGTGLGLATVFGIVQRSGGHLAVTSSPGQGTRFDVYLPRSKEPVQGRLPEIELPQAAAAPSRETILLVEDEASVRTASRTFLEQYGYHVLEAADGAEALDIFTRADVSVDAVVTDVVMPEMGGRELVERLTAVHPGIPVLYVSGYTDSARVRSHLARPSISLLRKPFTPAGLAHKVREVLAASAAERLS